MELISYTYFMSILKTLVVSHKEEICTYIFNTLDMIVNNL